MHSSISSTHIGSIGIIVECGGQCGPTSAFQYDGRCANFFNTLGIEQCNQTECNQTEYDLSACITASTEISTTSVRLYTTTNQNADCQCNRDRDTHTNNIATTGQSVTHQACTPTIVYRTETINGSRMVEDNQLIAALTIIIVILIVLLVTVSIALIWTCWKPKLKRGLKRDEQQAR